MELDREIRRARIRCATAVALAIIAAALCAFWIIKRSVLGAGSAALLEYLNIKLYLLNANTLKRLRAFAEPTKNPYA